MKLNARAFAAQGKAKGPDIQIVVQPGQNPDVNADDLAFFYSLETDVSLMAKETRKELRSSAGFGNMLAAEPRCQNEKH